jgi:hypothetical protein
MPSKKHALAAAILVDLVVVLLLGPRAAARSNPCPVAGLGTPGYHGGIHGDRSECVLLADHYFGSGWRLTYEPADSRHGAAIRSRNEGQTPHHHLRDGCEPTREQKAYADWLVGQTRRSLMERYLNKPWQALADGFVPYPVPSTKWFHMVNPARVDDGPYAPPSHGKGDPASRVFNPDYIESFMYGMTDEGLTPLGGMFVLPSEYKDWDPADLPNPTGCLMQWHNHTGTAGLATSFDPSHPDQSVWMSHVWTYGGIDPWGRDYDGSEPEGWFAPYRVVPALCDGDGGCI